MEIAIFDEPGEAARYGARIVVNQVRRRPRTVLGLATGSTPTGLYREVVRMRREEGIDFSQVTTFNLDEYVGLPPDHPQSYRRVICRDFLDHLDIPPGRIHVPNGMAVDIEAECLRYEDAIRAAGGIDIQILGIGRTGHIGFNEPGSSLGSRTRVKELTPGTIRDNARFFGSEDRVPRHAITMGVGTIMEARRCLMLAFGGEKAGIVARAIEGPLTHMVTASMLQLHPRATVLLDRAAASELQMREYYEWAFSNKPSWERE